jgi:hypothetical protein
MKHQRRRACPNGRSIYSLVLVLWYSEKHAVMPQSTNTVAAKVHMGPYLLQRRIGIVPIKELRRSNNTKKYKWPCRRVASLLVLVQLSDTNGVQSAFNGLSAIPEVLAHECADHIEGGNGGVTAPEFVVSFPRCAAPGRLWETLLEARK